MAKKSIVMRQGQAQRVQIEKAAAAALYPGHMLELTTADKVQKHSTQNGIATPPMFALEDENQGNDITDAFAADDKVVSWIPQKGDWVLAVLADGQTATIGAKLASNGDGTLKVHTSAIVAIAMEALDLSDSSGAETADAELGYDKRLWVMIV